MTRWHAALSSLGLLSLRPPAHSLSPGLAPLDGFSREPPPAPRPICASQRPAGGPELCEDMHRPDSTTRAGASRKGRGRLGAGAQPASRPRAVLHVAEPALTGAGAPHSCFPPARLPLAQPVTRRTGPVQVLASPQGVAASLLPQLPSVPEVIKLSSLERRSVPVPHRTHPDPSQVPDGPGLRTRGSGPGRAGTGTGLAR